jgi:hypothetical protein
MGNKPVDRQRLIKLNFHCKCFRYHSKLIIKQLQKNKDDEQRLKRLLQSSSTKESYFRDQIDQLTLDIYQMDYEFK